MLHQLSINPVCQRTLFCLSVAVRERISGFALPEILCKSPLASTDKTNLRSTHPDSFENVDEVL
jgi:hypothetical protein